MTLNIASHVADLRAIAFLVFNFTNNAVFRNGFANKLVSF